MSRWRLIDSGLSGAARNMALDEALATEAARPVLRFYGWSGPAVSIGCFQGVEDLDLGYLSDRGIELVRRITGGRGILHGSELTYSFSAPAAGTFAGGLGRSYMLLGGAFARAFDSLGLEPETSGPAQSLGRGRSPLCFESASLGEIKLGGRKIVGSAQKRWLGKFMQQGSVPFEMDLDVLGRVFRQSISADAERSITCIRDVSASVTVDMLKTALVEAFEDAFGIKFELSAPTEREESLAVELEGKYRSEGWTKERQRRAPAESH